MHSPGCDNRAGITDADLFYRDASGDPRVAELAKVQGLRLEQWPQNLGFLRSCNAAAKLARGDFLFFLNNDTEVMPSAIDALAGLLDRRADAGMVGARLVYPDGVLQEAGGIIWRDGSGSNYGNRDDPRKHQYNYVREVDYCSGAAIMLPRARWDEMGGFDEVFLPAYYEDSDLAFRLRAAGWKVLYQPRAIVVHHEGVSHGTDTGTGIMAYQVENTRKLALRWGETLARKALPNGKQIMRARDRAMGRKITLVIDYYVPEPDRNAGSRTMLAFMEALVSSGRIVKFMPDNLYRTPEYSDALEDLGIEILHDPWTESLAVWISENGADVDEVLVSRPDIAAKYLPLLRQHCRARSCFMVMICTARACALNPAHCRIRRVSKRFRVWKTWNGMSGVLWMSYFIPRKTKRKQFGAWNRAPRCVPSSLMRYQPRRRMRKLPPHFCRRFSPYSQCGRCHLACN